MGFKKENMTKYYTCIKDTTRDEKSTPKKNVYFTYRQPAIPVEGITMGYGKPPGCRKHPAESSGVRP